MKKGGIGINYSDKRLLQKYWMILFSIVLVFGPFSRLGELAYAEGDSEEASMVETIVLLEENVDEKLEETREGIKETNDKPQIQTFGGVQVLTNPAEDYEFRAIPGQGTTIIKYNGNDTQVIIPKSLGGYAVRFIAEEAFAEKNIEAVTIPGEIKEIGNRAFANNKLFEVIITNKELEFGSNVFADNQENPSDFTIYGLKGSNAETYASQNGHTFEAIDQSDFHFNDNFDGTVTITGYRGTDTNVTIPDKILGKDVIAIGGSAFRDTNITKVTIPDSVKTIEEWAFYSSKLQSIDLGKGIETIEKWAFYNNNIRELFIPASLTALVDEPFLGNPLDKIEVDPNNTVYKDVDTKGLYSKDGIILFNGTTASEIAAGTEIIWDDAFNKIRLGSVIIPNSVKEIGKSAFSNTSLSTVQIGTGVETIEERAFERNSIEEVIIPGNVKKIKQRAFSSNDTPMKVTFNEGLKEIEYYAFHGVLIKDIEIPDGVTSIGMSAFEGSEVEKLRLPDSLTTLGAGAFFNHRLSKISIPNGLTEIIGNSFATEESSGAELTLPESVEKIDDSAFRGSRFNRITVENSNDHFKDVDGKGLYTRDGKKIILGTTSGEIAPGTEEVGANAFINQLGNLSTVQLPKSVKNIGESAFYGNSLTHIHIPGTVIEIDSDAFAYNQLEELHLLEGLQKIASDAFADNLLTFVEIPSTVEQIHGDAFYGNQLEKVMIRSKNVSIDPEAFLSNQDKPENLIILGYTGSTAEDFAFNHGHTFIPLPHQLLLNHAGPYDFDSEEIIEIIDNNGEIVGMIEMPEFDELSPLAFARLLIRDVAEEDVTATGLEVAGQIVDILFVSWEYDYDPDHPNEDEILNDEINELNEEFGLSLRINDDVRGDIAMYHEAGQDDWNNVGGNVENGFITATVTDFSKYGVFAMVEEEPTLIDIRVNKEWEGEAQEFVTVHLLANGEITDTIELSDENDWKHSFLEYPLEDGDGNVIDYTVVEDHVEGYKTSITGSAEEGFVITNTEIVEDPIEAETPETPEEAGVDPCESQDSLASGCPEEEIEDERELKDGSLPKTATNTFNILFAGIVLLLLGGTTAILATRRKTGLKE